MSTPPDLHLAFDVGHSSIGWAVFALPEARTAFPKLLGTGAVTFRPDDCLASQRRLFRRQRRHIRSTRQRIARIKLLLANLGVLTVDQLNRSGSMNPWKLASDAWSGGRVLTWPELWDVLRWYAHNRGYDGNRRWSAEEALADEEEDETEKVENARRLMKESGHETMAQTMMAYLARYEKDIEAWKSGERKDKPAHFKGLKAAFPRDVVEAEVRNILGRLAGKLPKLDAALIAALCDDWHALPFPGKPLPMRFAGGLLFGQLVPRFDNRLIAQCPQSGGKVPTRNCPEFHRYRWAMQLANVKVQGPADADLRNLEAVERLDLHHRMEAAGALTKGEFKKAVRTVTKAVRDNLDQLLLHPDADDALVLDPVQKLIHTAPISIAWPHLDRRTQQIARGQWRRGKSLKLADLTEGHEAARTALRDWLAAANTKKRKKDKTASLEDLLGRSYHIFRPGQRAPFAREVMENVFQFVLKTNRHPADKGGPIHRSAEILQAQLQRRIDEQTNNHLIRHRLRLLAGDGSPKGMQGLLQDLIADPKFAGGDASRIKSVVVEVNRELRDQSGLTRKEVEKDLGLRLASHRRADEWLKKAFAGKPIHITAGLIRKARIALDLGCKCPYTGAVYDPYQLLNRKVDRDHVIPRSLRATDSLESLVITFPEINKLKSNLTAARFVEKYGGQPVPGLPHLTIKTPAQFKADVEALESFKGHPDDTRRKRRRKELLLLADYTEKEFTPGDLTQTSHLTRLAVQAIKARIGVQAVSLPGAVTGAVRKSWHLLGCLAGANKHVLDEDEGTKNKTDIRGITHLHHALDAAVLGLASWYFPNNGALWTLMAKRKLNPTEQAEIRALSRGLFGFDSAGRFGVLDLPDEVKREITERLADLRVVQHQPSRIKGLRVEQNVWRVVKIENGWATLRQSTRGADGVRVHKQAMEAVTKLLGPNPPGGDGKLARIKGALIIPDNFGIAILDHATEEDDRLAVLPWHKVWPRLQALRKKNAGHLPRIIRLGSLVEVLNAGKRSDYRGVWMIRGTALHQRDGVLVDLAVPDLVDYRKFKPPYAYKGVNLSTLVACSLQIVGDSLAGVPARRLPKEQATGLT